MHELHATAARAAIEAGSLTARALVAACLARIAERDRLLGAWAHVAGEAALARAEKLDAQRVHGALHGIPVGLKDVLDTLDMPTAHGSALYRGDIPARDAACVTALRAAGAVVVGKTTTTEFASPIGVGVRNPHDFTRTPGVSSSGSAAAVADFHVPVALGTQTGGSVIRPASYCGIVGYKGDIDAFDLGGIRHVRLSLDALGIFARSLADIALVRRALGPRNAVPLVDESRATHPPRFALCRTPEWGRAQPSTRTAIEGAVTRLRDAGAAVAELELPAAFDRAYAAFGTIVVRETADAMSRELARRGSTPNAWLGEVASKARSITDAEVRDAQHVAAACRAWLREAFDGCDAILTPAAAGEAPIDLHGPADRRSPRCGR